MVSTNTILLLSLGLLISVVNDMAFYVTCSSKIATRIYFISIPLSPVNAALTQFLLHGLLVLVSINLRSTELKGTTNYSHLCLSMLRTFFGAMDAPEHVLADIDFMSIDAIVGA